MTERGLAFAALFFAVGAQAQAPGPDELAVWHVRDGIYMLVEIGRAHV